MACVYKHITKDTHIVFYIGMGINKYRATDTNHRNKYWHNTVKKHGFIVEIIEDNIDWDYACERETYWIKHYGRRDLNEGTLVNMRDGGQGNNNISEELKQNLREKMTGDKNPFFGKTHTEDTKRRLSELSKKNNPKYWLGKKGHPQTEETRRLISIKTKEGKLKAKLKKQCSQKVDG